NTLIVWTNELGKGSSHTLDNIPFVLVGGGLDFKMGRSVKFSKVPHNRLLLSLAHGFGHRITKFGKPDFCGGGPFALSYFALDPLPCDRGSRKPSFVGFSRAAIARERAEIACRFTSPLPVEHLADLRGQDHRGEWLLEELDLLLQDAVADDRVVGVPAHIEHSQLRVLGGDPAGQVPPAH